jgi:O-antigen/teichoic acid export membrane protein
MSNKFVFGQSIILFLKSLLTSVLSLLTVRYLVEAFGIVEYGIFVLVSGVVIFISVFSQTLSLSVQRFFSVYIGKGDEIGLSIFFIRTILLFLVLSIILVFINEIVVSRVFFYYTNFPSEYVIEAKRVFRILTLSMFFNVLSVPFLGMLLAKRNILFYSLLGISDSGLKLLGSVIVGFLDASALVTYTVLLAAFSFMYFISVLSWCFFKYLRGSNFVRFKFEEMSELLNFSGWTFFGSLAGFFNQHGNAVAANTYFGPSVNAFLGVSSQINSALNLFSNSIFLATRPVLIELYSASRFKEVSDYLLIITKSSILLLLLIGMPLLVCMEFVVHFWLGESFLDVLPYAKLMVCYNILFAMQSPITSVIHASGKVRNYHLIVESIVLLSVPLSVVFFSFEYEAHYSIISSIVVFSLAHIVRLFFLGKSVTFLLSKKLMNIYLFVVFFGYIVFLILERIQIVLNSSIGNISAALIVFFINLFFIPLGFLFFVFTKVERQLLIRYVKGLFCNFRVFTSC